MKPPTKMQRYRLAMFNDGGGKMTDAAFAFVQDVQWLDQANNLAIDVGLRCEGLEYSLRAVLDDPKATRVFLANLRRVLGPNKDGVV